MRNFSLVLALCLTLITGTAFAGGFYYSAPPFQGGFIGGAAAFGVPVQPSCGFYGGFAPRPQVIVLRDNRGAVVNVRGAAVGAGAFANGGGGVNAALNGRRAQVAVSGQNRARIIQGPFGGVIAFGR